MPDVLVGMEEDMDRRLKRYHAALGFYYRCGGAMGTSFGFAELFYRRQREAARHMWQAVARYRRNP